MDAGKRKETEERESVGRRRVRLGNGVLDDVEGTGNPCAWDERSAYARPGTREGSSSSTAARVAEERPRQVLDEGSVAEHRAAIGAGIKWRPRCKTASDTFRMSPGTVSRQGRTQGMQFRALRSGDDVPWSLPKRTVAQGMQLRELCSGDGAAALAVRWQGNDTECHVANRYRGWP